MSQVTAADESSRTAPPSRPDPTRPLQVAVAGLGRLGLAHAAVLSSIPGWTLAGFADERAAARSLVRGMGWTVPAFASLEKLLAQLSPDAVFVCVPQHRRPETARRALEAGAAVLLDKPMAQDLARAEEVVRFAAERDRRAACGHALVHHPVFARAREIVAAGAFGALRQARSSVHLSLVFSPWQARVIDPALVAGGVVAHEALDLLFLLVNWLGMPIEVRATWSRIYGGVEDELRGMMRLPGGADVGFDASWSVPGYRHAAAVVELEGENGRLLVSEDELEIELASPAAGFPAGRTRLRNAELPQPARFDLDGESLYLQDAAFLAWVSGGPPPPATAAAALEAHRVMDALYRSARAGGTPVRVLP